LNDTELHEAIRGAIATADSEWRTKYGAAQISPVRITFLADAVAERIRPEVNR
jgi:hypothetical protein